MLLVGASLEQAEQTAERMRRSLESQSDLDVSITASFGLSSLRFGADDLSRLIDQADQALYASKQRGRNCVTRWDWTKEFQAARSAAQVA